MSQIEQDFRKFLSKKPEIEKCYSQGLINRRSLARYLIVKGIAKKNQVEATIAMLRRFEFKDITEEKEILKTFRINIKDKIVILDFEKEKSLLEKMKSVLKNIDYDKGEILKIVVGSTSIKVFIDERNESAIKPLLSEFKLNHRFTNISELSLMFDNSSIDTRGIISTITRELVVNDVIISELLTASPELIIYLQENYIVKAYEVLKELQK